MKQQQEQHLDISAALAFMLIPLGGFATDIYLPSFPSMASDLGVGVGQIQLSLLLFMVSLGVCQFFAGAALDSFGRYRISMGSLVVFSAASVAIAISRQIEVILCYAGITRTHCILGYSWKTGFFCGLLFVSGR